MMAFFFTMPISMISPTNHKCSAPFEEQQREQRAEARRGQPGENRQRVDVALVQHPKTM